MLISTSIVIAIEFRIVNIGISIALINISVVSRIIGVPPRAALVIAMSNSFCDIWGAMAHGAG